MTTSLLIVLVILILALIGFIITLFSKINKLSSDSSSDQSLQLLQNQIQEQMRSVHELSKTLDQKLVHTNTEQQKSQRHLQQIIQEQFDQNSRMIHAISGQSNKMIANITEKLTTLDKTNQQVIGFSEQLGNLERVLRSQKKRGNLGEAGLQLVLENILPPNNFSMQYKFDDGDVVDAVIFTKDGIIPVDAKFPLENYERLVNEPDDQHKEKYEKEFKNDLKKRIDETSKYIKKGQGTLEFAFMFIPSEAIYYDLLVNEVGAVKVNTRSLIDYAFNERKVIIVSPTTFAAYLQTVLQGLRALKIEESAKSIRENVEKLHKHIKAYDQFMQKLGNSMSTTVNHFNSAYKELGKIDKDVVRITKGDRVIEPLQIERPKADD